MSPDTTQCREGGRQQNHPGDNTGPGPRFPGWLPALSDTLDSFPQQQAESAWTILGPHGVPALDDTCVPRSMSDNDVPTLTAGSAAGTLLTEGC